MSSRWVISWCQRASSRRALTAAGFRRYARLCVLGAVFTVRQSAAQPSAEAGGLVWERGVGAESCLSEAELRATVVRSLGRDPFTGSGGSLVRGQVQRDVHGLRATLSVSATGDPMPRLREFRAEADDCASLGEAVALAIAMSFEHADVTAPPKQQAAPEPKLLAPPVTTPRVAQPAPSRSSTELSSGRHQWALSAEAHWSVGMVPSPATGPRVLLRRHLAEHWSLGLGAEWVPKASERGQFSVAVLAARADACLRVFSAANWSVASCAGARLTKMRAENEAHSIVSAKTGTSLAPLLAMRASAQLGERWVAELGMEGALPLARPIFRADSCPQLAFQQPIVTFGAFVGFGVLLF